MMITTCFFFFSSRRRHTRWPRDWSSDVALPIVCITAQALPGRDSQRKYQRCGASKGTVPSKVLTGVARQPTMPLPICSRHGAASRGAAMKFGVFDHMDDGGVPLSQQFEARMKLAEAYDRFGFHAYHLAEHHGTPLGLAPSPGLFMAALAQRTKRLRFGPLVYLLPLYHPLRLIEEICMLDHMSGGRLELGVGRGVSPIEVGFYGVDPAEGQRRFAESLKVIKHGLTVDEL